MNFFDCIKIGIEALFVNKIRTVLTLLGIIIGVLSIILLVSIGQGAKKYVYDELSELGSNLLLVTPGKIETTGGAPIVTDTIHKLTYGDTKAIKRRTTVVKDVAPLVIGSGKIKYKNHSRDALVVGVTHEYQTVRNLHVEIGSFISSSDVEDRRRVCAIGRTVKRELFSESNPLGGMIKIINTRFRVIGIMEKKGRSLGVDIDDYVWIPIQTAQELFNTDQLTQFWAKANSEKEIEEAKKQITEVLTKRHNNNEDFTVTTQAALLASASDIMGILTWALGAIAGISLIVGGIGIMNIMLVSVTERTREIGVRKAVGAKSKDILLQFLIESVSLSVFGGLSGILLGMTIGFILPLFFSSLPVNISLWAILLAFSFSVSVGVFFGVYPARKASLLDPILALRYE